MPDYSPLFLPGLTITSTAQGTITGGDPVEVAGTNLVQKATLGPSGLGSQKYVGIAAQDATAGSPVTVVLERAVHQGTTDGAVTAGDQLMASAQPGCQVKTVPQTSGTPTQQDVNQARCIIGLALTTAGNGGTVTWMQK